MAKAGGAHKLIEQYECRSASDSARGDSVIRWHEAYFTREQVNAGAN